jgi:hypothetical protein
LRGHHHAVARDIQREITHLVVDLLGGVLEVDRLLENIAFLLELDALGPVVEGTGDIDLLGGMLPRGTIESAQCLTEARSNCAAGQQVLSIVDRLPCPSRRALLLLSARTGAWHELPGRLPNSSAERSWRRDGTDNGLTHHLNV